MVESKLIKRFPEQLVEVLRHLRGRDAPEGLALQRLQHLHPQERTPLHVCWLLHRAQGISAHVKALVLPYQS